MEIACVVNTVMGKLITNSCFQFFLPFLQKAALGSRLSKALLWPGIGGGVRVAIGSHPYGGFIMAKGRGQGL